MKFCTSTDINTLSPQMTESCRSCVCGHVFEDVKKIGGKRFSGNNNDADKNRFYTDLICTRYHALGLALTA